LLVEIYLILFSSNIFSFSGTAIPLLDQQNQWLVQENSRDQCQTRLIDENAKLINQFDCVGSNLTLVDKDQIVFLSQIGIYFYHKRCFV